MYIVQCDLIADGAYNFFLDDAENPSSGSQNDASEHYTTTSDGVEEVNDGSTVRNDDVVKEVAGANVQTKSSLSTPDLADVAGEYIVSLHNFNQWNVVDLVIPPKQQKRGRPKGAEKTVIGLPLSKKINKGPLSFLRKTSKDRKRSEFCYYDNVLEYFYFSDFEMVCG